MNRVPTVRVANPNLPGTFMVINYDDMKHHHELWHEQDEDFQRETSRPALVATEYTDEELRVCVRVLGKLFAERKGISLDQWRGMQPNERIAEMLRAEDGLAVKKHEHADQPETVQTDEPLRIGKGPGGKIYVMRGANPFSGPYSSRSQAEDALKIEQDQ